MPIYTLNAWQLIHWALFFKTRKWRFLNNGRKQVTQNDFTNSCSTFRRRAVRDTVGRARTIKITSLYNYPSYHDIVSVRQQLAIRRCYILVRGFADSPLRKKSPSTGARQFYTVNNSDVRGFSHELYSRDFSHGFFPDHVSFKANNCHIKESHAL